MQTTPTTPIFLEAPMAFCSMQLPTNSLFKLIYHVALRLTADNDSFKAAAP
jgi:hypothetical protein